MITELYIDNFRCLVNCTIRLTEHQLWLGDNGTGKSSVLDALQFVQRVISGDHVEDIFIADDMTRWLTKPQQTFGIVLKLGDDSYEYELVVEPDRNKQERCRIASERLSWNGQKFYWFDGREAHLYRINRDTGKVEEGTQFSADWSRSLIPTIAERDDNRPLVEFRRHVGGWLVVQPIPANMGGQADKEDRRLARDGHNFAAWYRHLCLESAEVPYKTGEALQNVLESFQALNLKEAGEARKLVAKFRSDKQDYKLEFPRLSDGQRQLIFLYVVLYALQTDYPVLFIDEPDNFISSREIQPWLHELCDICDDSVELGDAKDCQAIVISHHPETVNVMTDGTELWFHRPQASHTQVKSYPVHKGLTPAETLARGWENE